jgi:glycosyltransferase involved in cell wall biosynthesis
MRIDQVLVGASPGDAITESALATRDALRASLPSEVYAYHRDARLHDEVRHLDDLPPSTDADVVVLHVSIGEPKVVDLVLRRSVRLVLAYHNITPAEHFQVLDPAFAAMLRGGRRLLHPLAQRAIGAIADSTFNADELRALGMTNVEVAPPVLNLDRLADVEPDAEVLDAIERFDAPFVLWVGQMLPHKRPELAIEAHHLLNVNDDSAVRLVLAGPHRQTDFASAVTRHVQSLNLPTVWMTGEVSDAQLSAFYRRASLLLVTSDHEGFCVPLAEAFSFGLPVVARGAGAIPETAGGAALVLAADAGAAEVSEAVAAVLRSPTLRAELAARGRRRSGELSSERTLERSLRALSRVLAAAGHPVGTRVPST